MRNDTVPLHFTKSQPACPASTMCRLPGNCYNWTPWPCVHLIIDQMPKSLIVNGTNKDQVFKLFTTVRIEHNFISVLLVAMTMNFHCLLLHVKWPEWRRIFFETTLQGSHLTD